MSAYPDLSKERFEDIQKEVINSILKFCSNELNGDGLDSDQKESLMVAKQCIEACYETEEAEAVNAVDLIELFRSNDIPSASGMAGNSAELEAEAEVFKVKGNDAMKENNYSLAVDYYTEAIKLYKKKAIYYCNRAAAYSKLDRHRDAISDCKEAIKLDGNYGKAYGRLGIAYANMNMYREAVQAYTKALELDPTNVSYESNLRLAEEKIASAPGGGGPAFGNFDFGGLMNNPALLSMASQMLNDPSFRNMVSGIMTNTGGSGGDPLESFVEVGQQLAEHMQQNSPDVLENIRQTIGRVRDQAGSDDSAMGAPGATDGASDANSGNNDAADGGRGEGGAAN